MEANGDAQSIEHLQLKLKIVDKTITPEGPFSSCLSQDLHQQMKFHQLSKKLLNGLPRETSWMVL